MVPLIAPAVSPLSHTPDFFSCFHQMDLGEPDSSPCSLSQGRLPRDQPGTGFWKQSSTRATGNRWTGFISAVCAHTDLAGERGSWGLGCLGCLCVWLQTIPVHPSRILPILATVTVTDRGYVIFSPIQCQASKPRPCHVGTLETEAGRSPVPGQPGL